MNKVKAICASAIAGILTLPSTLFAEGTNPIDMSDAEAAADNIGSALKDLIVGKIMDNVVIVVGAALAVYGVFLVVKWVRRGAR